MRIIRYWITAILLIIEFAIILSFNATSNDSQNTIINPPTYTAENPYRELSIFTAVTVFVAGLLAGFNPCLLAILAFLASTMLASTSRRRDILTMVAFFSLGIFVVYIIFGIGLFSVLQEESALTFRLILVIVLLILGLMQLEDARRLQSGGTSLFRTDWTKKYVHGVIASQRLVSYFLLGALSSLIRAPCVGGMYVAIIGVISSFPVRDMPHQGCFIC